MTFTEPTATITETRTMTTTPTITVTNGRTTYTAPLHDQTYAGTGPWENPEIDEAIGCAINEDSETEGTIDVGGQEWRWWIEDEPADD